MAGPRTVDTHTHVLTEETMKLLNKETPKVASSLKDRKGRLRCDVAGVPYRPLPRGGFDIEQRLKDMKASDVDMQVLSNTPQTFLYNQDAGMTPRPRVDPERPDRQARPRHPERFYGIATLPMQAPKAAADELERSITSSASRARRSAPTSTARISTIRSSSRCGRWRTEHDAFCMVHPNNVAGADRLKNYYLNNLIGNPLDTTIAAASLVFGGVIERFPNIKFFMVHGGGFTPYQAGALAARLARAAGAEEASRRSRRPRRSAPSTGTPSCTRKPQLEFLVQEFGAAHVMLGSDYPYDMGTFECARQVKALSISELDKATHSQRPGAEAAEGKREMEQDAQPRSDARPSLR